MAFWWKSGCLGAELKMCNLVFKNDKLVRCYICSITTSICRRTNLSFATHTKVTVSGLYKLIETTWIFKKNTSKCLILIGIIVLMKMYIINILHVCVRCYHSTHSLSYATLDVSKCQMRCARVSTYEEKIKLFLH